MSYLNPPVRKRRPSDDPIVLVLYPYPDTVPGYLSKWPMPSVEVALNWARVSGIRGRIFIEKRGSPAHLPTTRKGSKVWAPGART